MATATAEIPDRIDTPNDTSPKAAVNAVALKGARLKIDFLLTRIDDKQGARRDVINEYRKGAEADNSPDGVESFYKWIEEKWGRAEYSAIRISEDLDRAVSDNILNRDDRDFLLAALVRTDAHDFVHEHEKVLQLVGEKLERAKKDKEVYLTILNHPLLGEGGTLRVSDTEKAVILAEDDFMKKSLPERRELVKAWQEALKKAQVRGAVAESGEKNELETEYEKRLREFQSRGVIGEKTVENYLNREPDGFRHQSLNRQKEWLSKLPQEMGKYVDFWDQVDENLRPESAGALRSLIDSHGYSDLMREYQKREMLDRGRNERNYWGKLKEAKNTEKIIGRQTFAEFIAAFRQQDLKTQKEWNAPDVFNGQMERYRKLWKEIETDCSDDDQATLRERQDELGYTELKTLYQSYQYGNGGDASGFALNARARRILQSRVTNKTTREGMEEYVEYLEEQPEKRQRTVEMLKHMLAGVAGTNFNASRFQDNMAHTRGGDDYIDSKEVEEDVNLGELRQRAAHQKRAQEEVQDETAGEAGEALPEQTAEQTAPAWWAKWLPARNKKEAKRVEVEEEDLEAADYVEEDEVAEALEDVEEASEVKRVRDLWGYQQIDVDTENGIARRARVSINDPEGLRLFWAEDNRQRFRQTFNGGNDTLTFSVWRMDGTNKDLDHTESTAMKEVLEEMEKAA